MKNEKKKEKLIKNFPIFTRLQQDYEDNGFIIIRFPSAEIIHREVMNKYWTFKISKWSLYMVIAFAATIAISYFLAYKIARMALYFVLAEYPQKIRDNAAMFTGMCLFTGLNYIGQRFIVFTKKQLIPHRTGRKPP